MKQNVRWEQENSIRIQNLVDLLCQIYFLKNENNGIHTSAFRLGETQQHMTARKMRIMSSVTAANGVSHPIQKENCQ